MESSSINPLLIFDCRLPILELEELEELEESRFSERTDYLNRPNSSFENRKSEIGN
jgi:hypothetical protein